MAIRTSRSGSASTPTRRSPPASRAPTPAASDAPIPRRLNGGSREVLTSAIADKIILAVSHGAFPEVAAAWAGVSPTTWHRWLHQPGAPYETLRRRVDEARASVEMRAVAAVVRAFRDNPSAVRAYLESRSAGLPRPTT